FQAEDGIRDFHVTGVQTCALPIFPTFHRVPAADAVAHLVRWFWIPRWQLAPGRTSRQEVLTFPASNLTVEPDGVGISGPTTRIRSEERRVGQERQATERRCRQTRR